LCKGKNAASNRRPGRNPNAGKKHLKRGKKRFRLGGGFVSGSRMRRKRYKKKVELNEGENQIDSTAKNGGGGQERGTLGWVRGQPKTRKNKKKPGEKKHGFLI